MYSNYLGKEVQATIDRPMGSKHPKHGFIYPINYGFIPDTKAWDGREIDVFILGVFEPVETFEWVCIGYIHRKDDVEAKLVAAPKWKSYTKEQVEALVEFQEQWFDSEAIMA